MYSYFKRKIFSVNGSNQISLMIPLVFRVLISAKGSRNLSQERREKKTNQQPKEEKYIELPKFYSYLENTYDEEKLLAFVVQSFSSFVRRDYGNPLPSMRNYFETHFIGFFSCRERGVNFIGGFNIKLHRTIYKDIGIYLRRFNNTAKWKNILVIKVRGANSIFSSFICQLSGKRF